jgi:hypothetical protein
MNKVDTSYKLLPNYLFHNLGLQDLLKQDQFEKWFKGL